MPLTMGNGHEDEFTPPEAYPLAHVANKESIRILCNLTLHMYEHARGLDALRVEIARDPRPLGPEGWDRIAERLDSAAADLENAAVDLRVAAK